MKTTLTLLKRRRRGMTLVEMLFAVLIGTSVAIAVLTALIFVTRAQVTSQDISLVRTQAQAAINMMSQDIRNGSADFFNRTGWPGIISSGGNWELHLVDTADGDRITWIYNGTTRQLTRRSQDLRTGDIAREIAYPVRFTDFRLEPVVLQEFASFTGSGTGFVNRTTGVRLRARALQTLNSRNTTWIEVDGNNDGSYADDRVGAQLFGRTFRSDYPGWQWIYNVEVAFRNT